MTVPAPKREPTATYNIRPGGNHAIVTLLIGAVCFISLFVALQAVLADDHMRADMCRYAMRQVVEIDGMMREDKHGVIPTNFKRWIVEGTMKSEGYLAKNCPKDTKRSATQPSAQDILREFLKSVAQ